MLVLFVAKKHLRWMLTLSDTSESIQAKNHIIACFAIMLQLKKEIWKHILKNIMMAIFKSLTKFNKFLFCSVTNLAQNLLLVLFATNHFHVMLMLSDISESILAKNPLFANTVHMQQIIKEIWKNIFLKCIKKMLNLL